MSKVILLALILCVRIVGANANGEVSGPFHELLTWLAADPIGSSPVDAGKEE